MPLSLSNIVSAAVPGIDYLQRRKALNNAQTATQSGSTQAIADITGAGTASRDALQEYADTGAQGLTNLKQLTTPGADVSALLEQDPGYQFRLNQGQRALLAAKSATQTLGSGGTQKALLRYAQDYASNELSKVFDRNQSVAAIGQNAVNAQNASRQNEAANVGQLHQQIYDALASGDLARASTLTDMLKKGVGLAESLFGGGGAVPWSVPGTNVGGTVGTGSPLGAVAKGATAAGKAVVGAIGSIPLAGQIALGAAGAILLGKKVFGIGNTHEKADTWVQGNQNLFDQAMRDIDSAERGGQVSPDQAQQTRNALVAKYFEAAKQFAGLGSDQKTVIRNAQKTFLENYGDPSKFGASFPLSQQSGIARFFKGAA
jgi:hypothetical protein